MRFDEYDVEFFDIVTGTARASAARLVSYLVEWLRPENVIDVGCGEGAWLEAFAAAGCRVVGVDGRTSHATASSCPRAPSSSMTSKSPWAARWMGSASNWP